MASKISTLNVQDYKYVRYNDYDISYCTYGNKLVKVFKTMDTSVFGYLKTLSMRHDSVDITWVLVSCTSTRATGFRFECDNRIGGDGLRWHLNFPAL